MCWGSGGQDNLNQNAQTAKGLSSGFATNAQNTFSTLAPALTEEATNPQGFAPNDLAAMNTANNESTGGAVAGAIGQGNLEAARTRNAGGFAPALDEAAREGGRTLSKGALDIQTKNAGLKETQRQAGLSGLQSLYGTLDQATLNALGLSTQAYNDAANAKNPVLDYLKSTQQSAATAAAAGA